MKKFFTLVAAAFMAAGVSASEIDAQLQSTWSVQGGSNAAGVYVDQEEHYYNNWGATAWVAQAYTQFSLAEIPAGEVVTKAEYTVTANCGGSKNRLVDITVLPVGSKAEDFQVLKALADCGTKVLTANTKPNVFQAYKVDVTNQVLAAIANGDKTVIMCIAGGAAGGKIKGKVAAEGAPVLKLTTAGAKDAASYKVIYVDAENTEIKNSETIAALKDASIELKAEQTSSFWNGDVKYIYVSNDAEGKTVAGDGSTVVTVKFRKAEDVPFTVKLNTETMDSKVINGTAIEGEKKTLGQPKYLYDAMQKILYAGPLSSDKKGYFTEYAPIAGSENTFSLEYTKKEENSNIVYFEEAEDIDGLTPVDDQYTLIRMSNGKAGKAAELTEITTLDRGVYTLESCTRTGTTDFFCGENKVLEMKASGSTEVSVSEKFTVTNDETPVKALSGTEKETYFDYVMIRRVGDYNYFEVTRGTEIELEIPEGKMIEDVDFDEPNTNATAFDTAIKVAPAAEGVSKKDAQYAENAQLTIGKYYAFVEYSNIQYPDGTTSTETVCSDTINVTVIAPHTWDFFEWSDETIENLKAGAYDPTVGDNMPASNWSDFEKADKEKNTNFDQTKGKCYWQVAAEEGEIKANGVVIKELKGLYFTNKVARSLAIAVDYPEALSTYHGPCYLWLGSKNIAYFTIKNVKVGTTISMGVESHKATDARGVKLTVNGTELVDPEGNAVAAPTTYVKQTWAVPADAEKKVVDVVVTNTNGCHIYFIDAEIDNTATGVTEIEDAEKVAPAVRKTAEGIIKNGVMYNYAGQIIK